MAIHEEPCETLILSGDDDMIPTIGLDCGGTCDDIPFPVERVVFEVAIGGDPQLMRPADGRSG